MQQNDDLSTNSGQVTSSADVIERVSKNAERLSDVLEREYSALMDRDVQLINSLGTEKVLLLDTLARLEPHLRGIYNAANVQDGESSVQQLLQLCTEKNARNRSLVLIAIDQNRKALSLLRSVLKLDQTSVYSASGELNADKSKRYLGSA
ncbi:MAG: flagellar protein FlgN [Granulosicoccaceae bacterium]